ncbi:MAG TPA: chitobiase/beta-hexosaminidase C-terminal domain-containing protein [Cyclobacteriaceae bacterium]|jgi:hypothetical protein|nr:chitobiase/beta-hexosaminidase C-terminal domain-containing protein [Cyclobacteriaceae bacterium]
MKFDNKIIGLSCIVAFVSIISSNGQGYLRVITPSCTQYVNPPSCNIPCICNWITSSTIDPCNDLLFGNVVNGLSQIKSVTIGNNNGNPAPDNLNVIISIQPDVSGDFTSSWEIVDDADVTPIGGGMFAVNPIAPNAQVDLEIRFKPALGTVPGGRPARLLLTSNNSDLCYVDANPANNTPSNKLDVIVGLTGFSVSPSNFSAVLESEDAVLSGVVKKSTYTGFTGTGYADYTNNSTDYILWTVNVPSAGQYKLDFRYANGTTKDRPLEIRVNNVVQEASKSFPSTTLWTTWSEISSTVNLVTGVNTIQATAIGFSGGNFDHLTVSSTASAIAVAPAFAVVLTSPTASSTIYYTLDGTSPTQLSSVYTSAIAISSATTIKTFTRAAGYSDSPITTFIADVPAGTTTSNATARINGGIEEIGALEKVILYQNKPNPFKLDTEIKMYLPREIRQAQLYVYDFNGKLVKQIVVNERGETIARIEGGYLNTGVYAYTLVADGVKVDTLRMILTE